VLISGIEEVEQAIPIDMETYYSLLGVDEVASDEFSEIEAMKVFGDEEVPSQKPNWQLAWKGIERRTSPSDAFQLDSFSNHVTNRLRANSI
jgi:hypothetical protein